jgi:hypothetical protein
MTTLSFCDPDSGKAQLPIPYMMDPETARRFNLPNFRNSETKGILTASFSGLPPVEARFGVNRENKTRIVWAENNPDEGYDQIELREGPDGEGPPGYEINFLKRLEQLKTAIPPKVAEGLKEGSLKLSDLTFLSLNNSNWQIF